MNGDRWKTAQEYEKGFWRRVAKEVGQEDSNKLEFYAWRSQQLVERLKSCGLAHMTEGETRSLEIGSGPIGVSAYFPATERVALDPLEEFYRQSEDLVELRDPNVTYLPGVGESLPQDDNYFDLVMIENCIDHVENPSSVMSEIHRVLRPDGILYLTVNCRSRWGYVVHRLLSRLRIDAGHPHTFTPTRVKDELIKHHGFQVLQLETASFLEAWRDDIKGPGLKKRFKGFLGVSEYLVTVLAIRKS